jgi:hypothetical protein
MMVQMKCLSLNSMIKINKRILLIITMGLISIVLFGCQRDEYPRPTRNYYINDYANILDEATRNSITREGERLYKLSDSKVDGGAQLVVATFEVENESDVANYDKTEIYRQWEIGKNDMGILVILFFIPNTVNDIKYLELIESQIEVGYRMEQYLTPTTLGVIIDNTLYSDEWNYLDMAVMHMVYELLSHIYTDIYEYESFNYDMDNFQDYLDTYVSVGNSDISPMNVFLYLFSPYSRSSDWFTAMITTTIFLFVGGGGTIFLRNKGGGGSSGGMGIFRRRK